MPRLRNSRQFGFAQEAIALNFLRRQGMRLLARNFSSRTGEIDLIMLHPPDHLVFVEVRFRKSAEYGSAKASVTREKQSRIKRTAAIFLQRNKRYQSCACRFDVVAIEDGQADSEKIEWLRHAFY